MKRFLLCLLVVCVLLSVAAFVSCKKDGPQESTAETDIATTVATDGIVFPQRNYGMGAFRVLCTTQCSDIYDPDENEETIVSRAAFRCNSRVEEDYGIMLQFKALEGRSAGRAAFATEVRTTSLDHAAAYDLVIGQTYYTMALALEGLYFNMASSDYIRLNEEWYDKELINDNIMVNGKLYAASGGYVVSQISTMMGLYYNKGIYNRYHLGDAVLDGMSIYDAVEDGEWTYEKMRAMATTIYEDANYNDKVDAEDVFGFIGNVHAQMCALIGSDTPYTERDEWGGFSVDNYYNSHLVSVFEDYLTFFNNERSVYTPSISDEALIEMFGNSQSLFCCHAVEYMVKNVVRGSGIDYGIVPYPKFDEMQETYYTNNIRWEVANIPKGCDTERAAILFDYLNYIFHKDFSPEYFDLALSHQAAPSEEDSKMMYLIRDCVRFDFATFYQSQIGESYSDNIYIGVRSLIRNNDSGISSWWSSNKKLYTDSIQELMDLYLYYLDEE